MNKSISAKKAILYLFTILWAIFFGFIIVFGVNGPLKSYDSEKEGMSLIFLRLRNFIAITLFFVIIQILISSLIEKKYLNYQRWGVVLLLFSILGALIFLYFEYIHG